MSQLNSAWHRHRALPKHSTIVKNAIVMWIATVGIYLITLALDPNNQRLRTVLLVLGMTIAVGYYLYRYWYQHHNSLRTIERLLTQRYEKQHPEFILFIENTAFHDAGCVARAIAISPRQLTSLVPYYILVYEAHTDTLDVKPLDTR